MDGYNRGEHIENNTTLTVSDTEYCELYDSYGGAAIRNSSKGDAKVKHTRYVKNTAGAFGGAVFNAGSIVFTGGADFIENKAMYAGAVYSNNSASFSGAAFVNNSAERNGGAIENWGTLTVSDTSFTGNTAADGGAICNIDGAASLIRCTFVGNIAAEGSAIANFAEMTAEDCVFSGSQKSSGGTLFNASTGTITLKNVSFAGQYDTVINHGAMTWSGTVSFGGSVTTKKDISAAGASVVFDIRAYEQGNASAIIGSLSRIKGASSYSVRVQENPVYGTYRLADGASGFSGSVSVKTYEGETLFSLTAGVRKRSENAGYCLNLSSKGSLTVSVTRIERSNLAVNGYSQILAWDSAQGKVGYTAADGAEGPDWRGVWEWSGSEASMWKVVGAGHFSGSETAADGILLYNGYGNTFAAWTNLSDPSYGYVSLCHVDGSFQTKSVARFDENGFDDVVIYDDNGSVGIVSDAAVYHDVWHVDDKESNVWQLIGAGHFGGARDSLVFRNTFSSRLYLWDNQDPTFAVWDWKQTDIGEISDGWEVAAIGDFQGDGIDDIAIINHNDNDALFVWDDGNSASSHYVGCIGAGFKVESVGDYNGDGKEDLLLREYSSGWGGMGYWASADSSQWTDLNARIETDMESSFTIISAS